MENKQSAYLDSIEKSMQIHKWFANQARNFNEKDKKICLEFYNKSIKSIATLEVMLLESEIDKSKLIEKIELAKKFIKTIENEGYGNIICVDAINEALKL